MTPRLVLISGLSGSGKSTVAKCFEDLGYYVVDNLPLPLLRQFLAAPLELVEGRDRIAVVTDVRAPGFARELPTLLADLDRDAVELTLLFLESSDEALVRRFSETRRPHPMREDRDDLSVIESIRAEREVLGELRAKADMVIDTSEYSIHETRSEIYREFASQPGEQPSMTVSLVSFGFKRGIPYGTDLLFDVRFLANPHFVPGLRELTGKDAPVREYLEEQEDFHELLQRLTELLGFLLPRYRRENRSYVTVGIGCTGGRHRSIAVTEALSRSLDGQDWGVRVVHRDTDC